MMRVLYCMIFAGCFLYACSEPELIEFDEVVTVSGNTPPDYSGVSTSEIIAYTNKLYIDLWGRGPTIPELDNATDLLKAGQFSEESRESLVFKLQSRWQWQRNNDELLSQRMLVGLDTFGMLEVLEILEKERNDWLSLDLDFYVQIWEDYIMHMHLLLNAGHQYFNGEISVAEYHRRFIYNNYYDEGNAGAANYVFACVEDLYFRAPTESEWEDGISMVEGNPAVVFGMSGGDKIRFSEIVTSTDEFYQSIVRNTYFTLLAREPYPEEIQQGVSVLLAGESIQDLQLPILISEEYAGF